MVWTDLQWFVAPPSDPGEGAADRLTLAVFAAPAATTLFSILPLPPNPEDSDFWNPASSSTRLGAAIDSRGGEYSRDGVSLGFVCRDGVALLNSTRAGGSYVFFGAGRRRLRGNEPQRRTMPKLWSFLAFAQGVMGFGTGSR